LRIFPHNRPALDHEDVPYFGGLPDLLRSAREYTKREIVFVRAGGSVPGNDVFSVPVCISDEKTIGFLVLAPKKKNTQRSPSDAMAERFLRDLAGLLGDAYRWQYALRENEEVNIEQLPLPVVNRSDEKFSLSLREQMKDAVRLMDVDAASLYVLNSVNRTLKLRCSWGLPEERLLDPPRPLSRAMADVEAMLGHAVVLNDDFSLTSYNPPENFQTAACIPVTSNSTIFGTVWFFANETRDFDSREMCFFEVVAGRIAAELECRSVTIELNNRNTDKAIA
jgi:transcriptional regulator with GAF, ATPase, and Fis domain